MAFLGLNGIGGGSRVADEVIHVGDTSVGLNQLQSSINDQRKLLVANGVDTSLINDDVLQEQVIKKLINQILLEQQARKLGYTVSDSFITKELASYPVFQGADGKFSNEQFAKVLQSQGLTKEQLFNQKRTELAIQQLLNGILETAIYPQQSIEQIIDRQLETKEVWLYRIAWQEFAERVTVNEYDIKNYYDQHRDELKSVPMVDLSYIELTTDDIKIDAVTDEELEQQYELYKEKNNLADMRQLSQILLTGDDAEEKAKIVKEKLDKGADFAKVAKEYSDDLTADEGGAIGRFNPAMFNNDSKVVQEALMGLTVGDTSVPVKTSFGIQIFKVTADDGDSIPSLESLKEELTKSAETYKKQNLLTEQVTKINSLVDEGYSLQDIAQQEGLQVQTIKGYQKENNLTALSQPAIIEKAFDEFSLHDESVSPAIELDDKRVWLQSSNYRPTDVMHLEVATPIIKGILTQQKATDFAFAKAQALAKTIHNKEDLSKKDLNKEDSNKEVAKDKTEDKTENIANKESPKPVDYIALGVINRQYPLLEKQEVQVAFSDNSNKGLVAKATKTDTGASVVITEIAPADNQQKIGDAEKQQVAKGIRESFAENQLADYLDYLNASTKIEINQEKLNSNEGL